MENLAGIKMFSANDLCKGFHIAKETAYAIMKSNPKYFAPVRPIFCGGRSPLYQFCRRVNLHVC